MPIKCNKCFKLWNDCTCKNDAEKKECNHIYGYIDDFDDSKLVEGNCEWCHDYDYFIKFKYCPDCGVKLNGEVMEHKIDPESWINEKVTDKINELNSSSFFETMKDNNKPTDEINRKLSQVNDSYINLFVDYNDKNILVLDGEFLIEDLQKIINIINEHTRKIPSTVDG